MDDLADRIPAAANSGTTLVESIRTALRSAITSGSLPPGFRLREIALAERFDCSTTPVREAIRKLESEGLVKVYPRRGAEVTSFTTSEVDHLYEVRLVLETHAIRKAAELRPDKTALAPVKDLIDRQQELVKGGADEADLVDAEIHEQFALLAGNPAMAQLIARSTRQIEAVQSRMDIWVEGGTDMALAAHRNIFDAVQRGDADAAEQAMRGHLEAAREVVGESLQGHAAS
jgi:DNA-binding GntR family transcriptional regulator